MPVDANGRADPRISAPKMGEYLEATASRRERILRDQKFPQTFITVRYGGASDVIRRALLRGGGVRQELIAGALRLSRKPCETRYDEEARDDSVLAVEFFIRSLPSLDLEGVESFLAGRSGLAQAVEDVRISVYPVVLLKKRVRGQDRFGALLPVFGKKATLNERSGKAVATMLYEGLAASGLVPSSAVKPGLCLVVDVFREQVYEAPSSRVRLLGDIRSACREIAVRWPSIRRVA